MFKNIIFDWSGVISNDFIQAYEAAMYIFRHLGVKEMAKNTFRKAFFFPYIDFYKKYIPSTTKEEVDSLFKEALKVVPKPSIYPGVKKVLGELHNKKIKIVILSTHLHEEILKKAQDHKIKEFFLSVHSFIKDKKIEIREIIKQYNFVPAETLYVGDMVDDIKASRRAGIKSVAICWGYQTRETLKAEKPDYLINDLKELKKIV